MYQTIKPAVSRAAFGALGEKDTRSRQLEDHWWMAEMKSHSGTKKEMLTKNDRNKDPEDERTDKKKQSDQSKNKCGKTNTKNLYGEYNMRLIWEMYKRHKNLEDN